jgi:hypothetical protein
LDVCVCDCVCAYLCAGLGLLVWGDQGAASKITLH